MAGRQNYGDDVGGEQGSLAGQGMAGRQNKMHLFPCPP